MHHLPDAHKVKCFRTLVSVWSVVFRSTQFLETSQNFLNLVPHLLPPFLKVQVRKGGGQVGGILSTLTRWFPRQPAASACEP